MINRLHRFHGYGSLDYLYRHGQTVRSQLISLKWTVNPKTSSYRAAVVVSKKVAKSAPKRNRIRRRVYEVIRTQSINTHTDVVFTIFDERVSTLPHQELSAIVIDLLNRAKLLTKNP